MDADAGVAGAEAGRGDALNPGQLSGPFEALWGTLERLRPGDLPGADIREDGVSDRLPMATAAVYFLASRSRGLLYIGKAGNLRGRWRVEYTIGTGPAEILWSVCHAKLRPSIELGDVRLHWWAMPKKYISAAESILIQIHHPPWNSHRH